MTDPASMFVDASSLVREALQLQREARRHRLPIRTTLLSSLSVYSRVLVVSLMGLNIYFGVRTVDSSRIVLWPEIPSPTLVGGPGASVPAEAGALPESKSDFESPRPVWPKTEKNEERTVYLMTFPYRGNVPADEPRFEESQKTPDRDEETWSAPSKPRWVTYVPLRKERSPVDDPVVQEGLKKFWLPTAGAASDPSVEAPPKLALVSNIIPVTDREFVGGGFQRLRLHADGLAGRSATAPVRPNSKSKQCPRDCHPTIGRRVDLYDGRALLLKTLDGSPQKGRYGYALLSGNGSEEMIYQEYDESGPGRLYVESVY